METQAPEKTVQQREDTLNFIQQFEDTATGESIVEVVQVCADNIIDLKYFDVKSPITVGSELGYRLRFSGQP
ncbi:MAG: hypothetical protein VX278_09035, partial [Myxococcota bacterium]|nr:hypothetical protein [Myxococcota bacterium]